MISSVYFILKGKRPSRSMFFFKMKRFSSNYRSGTVNSNTVNSRFHLIRSFFDFLARFLSFHV